MIISQLLGGLGNQMFQYAAGKSLALHQNAGLSLDTSAFDAYRMHQGFELSRVFAGPFQIASETQIKNVLGWLHDRRLRRALVRLPTSILPRRFAVEPHFEYWSRINQLPSDCYLTGYWQSAKYFMTDEENIRADFTFRSPPLGRNLELAERIGSVKAVSLHVRRGDYATNPNTQAVHGLCAPAYYAEALRFIESRIPQAHVFVFSDDIAWVKKYIPVSLPHTFVDHNKGPASYNDMRLMSLCKHHIIANSSFSWWGAWLSASPQKIVVAPQKWFANSNNVGDLFPSEWTLL